MKERYAGRAWLLLITTLSVGVFAIQPAGATQTCSGPTTAFVGNFRTQALASDLHNPPGNIDIYGTKATIKSEYGGWCTGGSSGDSSAWAMQNGAGFLQYIQLGYDRTLVLGETEYFYESNDGVHFLQHFIKPWVAYSTHEYKVEYHASQHHSAAYLDTNYFAGATDFDPRVTWDHPWGAQWFGEAHDLGDDIPGLTQANAATFKTLLINFCSTCTYYDADATKFSAPAGVDDQPSRWGYTQSGVCNGNLACFEIWTY